MPWASPWPEPRSPNTLSRSSVRTNCCNIVTCGWCVASKGKPFGKDLSRRALAAIACSIIVASGSSAMSIAVTGFCCATDYSVDASTMASPSSMVVKYSRILCSPHSRAHPAAIVSRARLASSVAHALLQLCQDFVDREAGSLLPRRKSSERREEITNKLLDRDEHEGVIEHPVPVGIGRD